jgi:hypothetical protein
MTLTAFVVESNTNVTVLFPETSIIPGVPAMVIPGALTSKSRDASTMSSPGAAVLALTACETKARNLRFEPPELLLRGEV